MRKIKDRIFSQITKVRKGVITKLRSSKITKLRRKITKLRRNYKSAQKNYKTAQKLQKCAKITKLRITVCFKRDEDSDSIIARK